MSLPVAFQATVAATGTAQQLPNHPINGQGLVTLAAKAGNSASIEVGLSSAVTSSTGFIIAAGTSVQINLANGNTNQLWIVGTQNDVLSVMGN